MTNQSDATTPLSLADDFPPVSLDEWQRTVEAAGKTTVASLDKITADGIAVKPLYTASDTGADTGADKPYIPPGQFPFLAGTHPLGQSENGWRVRQSVPINNDATTHQQLHDALQQGVSELHLQTYPTDTVSTATPATAVTLMQSLLTPLLADVHLSMVGVHWQHPVSEDDTTSRVESTMQRTLASAQAYLNVLATRSDKTHEIRGNLGLDPVNLLLAANRVNDNTLDMAGFHAALQTIAGDCHKHYPSLKAVCIDLTALAYRGATPVQELSMMLAGFKYNLALLLEAGFSSKDAAAQIGCLMTTDTDYFISAAKLRAARVLWARLATACGVPASDAALTVNVQTSRRMMTRYEPTNNIMRASIAAAAAALGGADSIEILPFLLSGNTAEQTRAERIARNTAWLLMEESGLHRVVDPLAGSGYIESITEQLCASAWQAFQTIEASGSLANSAGTINQAIREADNKALQGVRFGRHRAIGTTDYATVEQRAVPPDNGGFALTREFERLRDVVEQHTVTAQQRPAINAIALGDRPAYLPRFEFARNLLAPAGITLNEPQVYTEGSATNNALAPDATIVIICADPAVLPETIDTVIDEYTGHTLYLVEKPGRLTLTLPQDQWLYRGMDQLDFLQRLLVNLEILQSDSTNSNSMASGADHS